MKAVSADSREAQELRAAVDMIIEDTRRGNQLPWHRSSWMKVEIRDVLAGYCNVRTGLIVIPLWAFNGDGTDVDGWHYPEYFIYYIAHELSHWFARIKNHGPRFYEVFTTLCPAEYQHFEFGYKPKAFGKAIKSSDLK